MDLLARLVAIAIASMASAPPAPVCTTQWSADVMGALDRCMDGDGDGCAAIGRDYESSCDAYSSIKWFSRGCALGSAQACDALKRVNVP